MFDLLIELILDFLVLLGFKRLNSRARKSPERCTWN